MTCEPFAGIKDLSVHIPKRDLGTTSADEVFILIL